MRNLFLALVAVATTIGSVNAQSRGAYAKNAGQPELARVVKLQKAEARGNERAAAKLDMTMDLAESFDSSMYVQVEIRPTGSTQSQLADAAASLSIGTKVVASVDFGQHINQFSLTNRALLVDSATNVPGSATKPYKFNSVIEVLNYFASKGFVIDRELGGKGFKFGRFGTYTLVKAGM